MDDLTGPTWSPPGLTAQQMATIRDAWRDVQDAYQGMMHADTEHWDLAVHRFNAAQAAYDALATEYMGLTPQRRKQMLEEVRAGGMMTDFFSPTG
ncbi:MAG: hypothetical protein ACYCYO_02170 [Bacilli bacterium]